MSAIKTQQMQIERTGDKITLPEKMTYPTAIEVLQRQMKYEEEITAISETFDGFVWDAALCFTEAMRRKFGWVTQEAVTHEFMGMKFSEPPELRAVEVGYKKTAYVPWGRFSLPGVEGYLATAITTKKDRDVFCLKAQVKRKSEKIIKELVEMTREILEKESIYKGKAFKLRLREDDGDVITLPMPSFMDVEKVKPEELIFSDDVLSAVSTSIFTPIEHIEECRKYKVPRKRGVLLYGPYGTGKTLCANVAGKKCTENGWTFLYCERADELADMVKLAQDYQPAVVFCEDVDRVADGNRSVKMDDLLNIIDGIESKNTELMVILTTNHVDTINKALLRPGRLDAVINVLPPDAPAVEKLLRIYGRGLIPTNADISKVAKLLEGTIPAVIRECAERAKLSQIKMGVGEGKLIVTPEALTEAARTMKNQLDLLAEQKPPETPADRLAGALQTIVRTSHNGDLQEIKDLVTEVRDNQD